MLKFVIVSLFLCGVVNGFFSNKTGKGRFVGMSSYNYYDEQADFDSLKYMAFISTNAQDPSLEEHVGTGIVRNKFWVVTLQSVTNGHTESDLTVTVCSVPTNWNGIQRRVKDIIDDPDCSSSLLTHCVALLRICPSITDDHAATIAPSLSPYRDTSVEVLLNNFVLEGSDKRLVYFFKKVGEMCECYDLTGFIQANHVCLAEDPVWYGEANTLDMKGLVVTNRANSEVIGFFVKEQTPGNGEIVLHLDAVKTFLDDNALIAPYEY